MTESRDKAAEYTRRTVFVSVLAIALGMVLLVTTLVWVLDYRRDVAQRVCQGQVAQNAVLHQVLLEAREDALQRATTSGEADRVADDFARYLELVPSLECDESGRPMRTEGIP